MALADMRKDYGIAGLLEKDLAKNPFRQFETWFAEAEAAKIPEPNAMTLATADRAGRPSARTVLLKAVDTNKFLPIWIGHPEAAAILMKLQGASTPRPMTHDLLFDMLGELEVACTRVSVTELRENTFYASITLSVNGREVEIDSRPSDALALAVRSGAPIFAAEDVIAESAIEFEHEVEDTEEVVDKFKEFLDRVTPEDFAGGDD